MKIKTFIKNIALTAALALSTTSCAEWLKVDMEDGIMEDALYSDNEGFLTVLNGIYSNLNGTYGSFWSMGAIDVMAQYYNVYDSNHPYYVYADYKYTESGFESNSSAVWTNLYNLIANINVLIDHCDKPGSAITERYYPIVKGEALALRAMIHFDLLRFYGPVYSAETENQPAIPYLDIPNNKEMVAISTAKEVAEKVFNDLKEAEKLLEQDPVRTDGVLSSEPEQPNETNDFRYRQYRLNYYAVEGLLTRLYMWTGNKDEAYNCVSKLIAEMEEKKTFPWITKDAATNINTPDRVFSTEVMFALYNTSRTKQFDALFNKSLEGNALSFAGGISGTKSKVEAFYGDNSFSDYRRKMWEEIIVNTGEDGEETTTGSTSAYFLKYEDVSTNSHFRYMIPLMRISEMYLTKAECTNDIQEAMNCVNIIRQNRNLTEKVEFTQENKMEYITNEFAREVIGEGQLFYYYKRHNMTQFMGGTEDLIEENKPFDMLSSEYVVPLPKSETDNRQ